MAARLPPTRLRTDSRSDVDSSAFTMRRLGAFRGVGNHGGLRVPTKKPPRFPEAAFVIFAWSASYFFFAARFSSIAACAAARRATGTRKGEQLT